MSESETFLSRWLRLKREADAALPPAPTSSAPAWPAAFDPASLPPIESIVADTDIQQFLHEAVPAELTRAALRSAWAADPAIRDFVGIAENQWNFNDHAGVPGFGPIEAADYLVAQAVGSLTNVAQEAPQEIPQEIPQETPREIPQEDPQESPPENPQEDPQEMPEEMPQETPLEMLQESEHAGQTAVPGGEPLEAVRPAAALRSHGGALPQ